jgi:hypothetical protein
VKKATTTQRQAVVSSPAPETTTSEASPSEATTPEPRVPGAPPPPQGPINPDTTPTP